MPDPSFYAGMVAGGLTAFTLRYRGFRAWVAISAATVVGGLAGLVWGAVGG